MEKGAILAGYHQARGHWLMRLKTPDQVKQLINVPINISNRAKPLTIIPRRKDLLITIFADLAITNEELVERFTKYGNVMKIAKGYYDFDGKIEDGRRLIFLHPKTEISEIADFIYVDGIRLHLHFKGKVVHCRVCDQKHPVEGGCLEPEEEKRDWTEDGEKGNEETTAPRISHEIKPNPTKENPIQYTTNNEPRLITTERTLHEESRKIYKEELREEAKTTTEIEAKETNKRSEKQNVEENIITMTESIGIPPNNKTPTKAAKPKTDFPGLPNKRRQSITPNKPKHHKEGSISNTAFKKKYTFFFSSFFVILSII